MLSEPSHWKLKEDEEQQTILKKRGEAPRTRKYIIIRALKAQLDHLKSR